MRKTWKYGKNGLALGAIIKAVMNANEQFERMQQNPGIPFQWQELLTEAAKGGVTAGLIGLGIGAVEDYINCNEKPINTEAGLYNILLKAKLSTTDRDYVELKQKAAYIIRLIKQRFGTCLKCDPIFMGSTERGTALNGKYDLDIGLLFLPRSFNSTATMFSEIYDFCASFKGKNGIVEVRVQKKSIGIKCRVNNKEMKIDLVPCKATSANARANDGYLCVNKNSLFGKDSTYTKTNIHLLNNQKLSSTQQNVVILLKEWKINRKVPLPSYLLENLVVSAYQYNSGRIPAKLTGKLIMVFEYISENLQGISIRSVENSNNILTAIPASDKDEIVNACNAAVHEFDYQKNSIIQTISK